MKKILWLALLLWLAGCGPGDGPRQALVKTVRAKAGSMPRRLILTGELRSRRRATISSVEAGIVARVSVVEGDRVREGQALVWLKPGLLPIQVAQKRAAVDASQAKIKGLEKGIDYSRIKVKQDIEQARQSTLQAELGIDQAQKEVQSAYKDMVRKKQLVAEKSIALVEAESAELKWKINQDQLKTAQSKAVEAREALRLALAATLNTDVQSTDLAAARAALTQSREDLAGTRGQLASRVLRSPISGVVINSTVEAGQLLGGGGESLLSIVDNEHLDVFVTMAQGHAGRLTAAMRAELTSDLVPERSFPIRFAELIPATDPNTNTVRARFSLLGAHHPKLLHGTPVRISLDLGTQHGLLVPHDVIHHDKHDRPYVRVVRDGNNQLQGRAVEVLASTEAFTLIKPDQLKPGARLVIAGGDGFPDGTTVVVEKE